MDVTNKDFQTLIKTIKVGIIYKRWKLDYRATYNHVKDNDGPYVKLLNWIVIFKFISKMVKYRKLGN